jgi:AcrR family transcriptional regulator
MKDKKQQIMIAAMSLIEKQGIAGLTVSDIAKKAKIGKGTVYEYFDSKESIFFESMEYGLKICIEELKNKTFVNKPDYKQAIMNFIDISYEIIKSGVFMSFTTGSKLYAFDSCKFNDMKSILIKHFSTILEVSVEMNQLGIKEGLVKKPDSELMHFAFVNMIFSTIMQTVNGNIKKGEDTNEFLYKAALKLFN